MQIKQKLSNLMQGSKVKSPRKQPAMRRVPNPISSSKMDIAKLLKASNLSK